MALKHKHRLKQSIAETRTLQENGKKVMREYGQEQEMETRSS